MNAILNLVVFILVLSAIIIIHEFGHLLAAKKFGVYCNEFSIGMGKVLFQRQKGETMYSIRILPIGGYVSMAGEEGTDVTDIPVERTIKGKKTYQQVIIMAAGAVMNVLLAWVIFIGVVMARGTVAGPAEPVISSIIPNTPAENVGLEVGDRIVKVTLPDGVTVYPETFDEIVERTNEFVGEQIIYTIERDGVETDYILAAEYNSKMDAYLIGIQGESTIREIAWYEAFVYGTQSMWDSFIQILAAIGGLFRGVGLEEMSGPVGIFQATSQVAQSGFISIILWIGLLSLNVGIFNLLPLPILDGGRIVISVVEKIIGRPLGERFETVLMLIGLFLLVGLMVFATWNDILRLFS